jgi:hypothetical protein
LGNDVRRSIAKIFNNLLAKEAKKSSKIASGSLESQQNKND